MKKIILLLSFLTLSCISLAAQSVNWNASSAKVKEGEREGKRQGGRGLHSAKSGEILSPDTPMWLIYSHIGISTLEKLKIS